MKDDTFVLDFVNDPDDIKTSFQPYRDTTGLKEITHPNILYDLQSELEYQVYTEQEVRSVNELEIKSGFIKSAKEQASLKCMVR